MPLNRHRAMALVCCDSFRDHIAVAQELKAALTEFVRFAQTLRGDEKSEAQTFLDHFFRSLGHDGVIEAGATFEFRVAKKPGSPQLELVVAGIADPGHRPKGGKKFADLLWPDRVLIEMKSRGENLEKHYDQAFDYWTHIVPKRPPFVILCNFDEFWIYDFNTQLFDPVDRIKIAELPENISSLNFLLPIWKKPIFGNNWVDVTRRAADQMATVFREIVDRGEDRERAQRFILQLLVALVAEDIGLLPEQLVSELLHECADEGGSSYDLIGGLFRQMASAREATGGRFVNVQYFNGGLFAVVDPIELKRAEAYRLCESAAENWAHVRPEIFGTLFQDSMDTGRDAKGKKVRRDERHAFGAHFTSEFDIRKVVGPTIVKPWRERIDGAGKNVGELRNALADLRAFRVLDPACGSGNFLFIAYREMKRLERDILLRLREVSKREPLESAISLHQFFGIDIIPFAVELAKVTLMLAKELEVIEAQKLAETDQLLIEEKPLPLDNLDKNIICADALFTDWPKADAIVGNPPFQSKNKIQKELGVEYVQRLRSAYPQVPGRADYCVYWFRKTHDHLQKGQHAGLVGTNTIRQNYSREGGLDYIVQNGGTITEAVSSQPWSGLANVHVSIVNWAKNGSWRDKKLSLQLGNDPQGPVQTWMLERINSSLSVKLDVTAAVRLRTNIQSKGCFQGQTHGHEGFLLSADDAGEMVRDDPRNGEVLFPFLTADEMLAGLSPERWVIDFQPRNIIESSSYKLPYQSVKAWVLPTREKEANEEQERNRKTLEKNSRAKVNKHHANFLKKWWLLSWGRSEMLKAISPLHRYISCGRVTKRPIFEFVSTAIRPNDALMVFPFDDDYAFGILQSGIHWAWFTAKCSTLTERYRYTSDTVFDTFPWPQEPTRAQIKALAEAAVGLRALRRETMRKLNYSLRDLYRTLEQPGDNPLRDAHVRLDAAVRAAYGMEENADPLAFLLELNLACTAKEKAGKKITPPGLPLPREEQQRFVTEDCIAAPTV
jgi:N-6 DNA Methylase